MPPGNPIKHIQLCQIYTSMTQWAVSGLAAWFREMGPEFSGKMQVVDDDGQEVERLASPADARLLMGSVADYSDEAAASYSRCRKWMHAHAIEPVQVGERWVTGHTEAVFEAGRRIVQDFADTVQREYWLGEGDLFDPERTDELDKLVRAEWPKVFRRVTNAIKRYADSMGRSAAAANIEAARAVLAATAAGFSEREADESRGEQDTRAAKLLVRVDTLEPGCRELLVYMTDNKIAGVDNRRPVERIAKAMNEDANTVRRWARNLRKEGLVESKSGAGNGIALLPEGLLVGQQIKSRRG